MNPSYDIPFDEKNEKREKSAEKIYPDNNINIIGKGSTQANTGINDHLEEEEDQKEDVKEDEKEKEEEKPKLIKLKEEESQTPYDPNSKLEVDNYLAQEKNLQAYREDQEDFQDYQEDAQNDYMEQDSLDNQVNENINENNVENNVENNIQNVNENEIMEDNLNQNHEEVMNSDIDHINQDIQPQAQDQNITENETTAGENEGIVFAGHQNFNDNNINNEQFLHDNNINNEQILQDNENMMDIYDFNPPNAENDDEKLDIDFYQPESNI